MYKCDNCFEYKNKDEVKFFSRYLPYIKDQPLQRKDFNICNDCEIKKYSDEKIGKPFVITREQMKKIETNKEMKNFWDEVNKIKK